VVPDVGCAFASGSGMFLQFLREQVTVTLTADAQA
jgi:hypothetical protein